MRRQQRKSNFVAKTWQNENLDKGDELMKYMSDKYLKYLTSKDKEWLIQYINWLENQNENLSNKLGYAPVKEQFKMNDVDSSTIM